MEIHRKNVHMNREKERAVSQITLDSDFNVPDIKPDIDKLILDHGEIQMEDVRPENDRIILKGVLLTNLLYASGPSLAKIQGMECTIPFEETVHMEDLESGDNLKIDWDIEDLNVSSINSRKLNVRAIITFIVTAEEIYDEELAGEPSKEEDLQICMERKEILCLCMNKKDTFRIREEVMLSGNQANIQELLWKDLSIQGMELRLLEGKLSIKGEMEVFALYEGENEEQIQWISQTLPFAGLLDLNGCRPEMISDIQVHTAQKHMEVKPDYDGEERILQTEAVLELDIRLYEEKQLEILKDAYSLSKELMISKKEARLDHLLMKNYSKARYENRMTVKQEDLSVLQICHTGGKVAIEEIRRTKEGIVAEGVILIQILYITSSDQVPICRVRGGIPFSHVLEVPGMDEMCSYKLKGELEQIHASMTDSQEAEIRASVQFHLLVCQPVFCDNVQSIEEDRLDYEKLQMLPGIAGCTVGDEDSLWDIAKRYGTTVERICQMNQISEGQIKSGQKLLVMKSVGAMHV